ncbi:phenylacetone monooxygenase [Colletotrichum incanum]|uniref:Phenylacetone monooxygenase n=1 Tax=Colletotrichum incanum TaxID=1573173 RepID=A0A167BAJ1_COLIC|nr:phenylacetone monooxygenase [Colletotrichum incanum]
MRGGPEVGNLTYLTKKFDLKKDIQFNTRIQSTRFQEDSKSWLLYDSTGGTYTCRYFFTAMGILNEPTLPNIPGVHDYKGEAWHTARWPDEGANLDGKRVAIIGTGATAIQIIQEIARRPEEMQDIRERYPEIFRQCLDSYSCFVHVSDIRRVFDMEEADLLKHWEALYALPGFANVLGVSGDIYTNREANKLYSNFHFNKIRQRVNDPNIAEKLIPKNHGFGTCRVALENGYYKVLNQQNVHLVDLTENPIERITNKGIKTLEKAFEFDVIIYATGFDAVTGSFRAVDFQGIGGA